MRVQQTRKVASIESSTRLTLVEPFSVSTAQASFARMRGAQPPNLGWECAMIVDSLPAVSTMKGWIQGGESLRMKLDAIDGQLYPLLCWILCSMRGHLRYVEEGSSDGFTELAHTKQFVLLCARPETESSFQAHATTAPVRRAFHGSPTHNWHSIIRDGLNFAKKSHGRAFGDGIYLSTDAKVSEAYSGGVHGRAGMGSFRARDCWLERSMFGRCFRCMAVCEVIFKPAEFVSQHPHWVVNQLDYVVTRHLCVFTESQGASISAWSGDAASLTQPAKGTTTAETGTVVDVGGHGTAQLGGTCSGEEFDDSVLQELAAAADSAAARGGNCATLGRQPDDPSPEKVDEVLAGAGEMGLVLARPQAALLLRTNHNHVPDAIAAAFELPEGVPVGGEQDPEPKRFRRTPSPPEDTEAGQDEGGGESLL